MAILRLLGLFLLVAIPMYLVATYYDDTRTDNPLKSRPANHVFTAPAKHEAQRYFE